jgi:quercetin dioxygenase-like cupin family protein
MKQVNRVAAATATLAVIAWLGVAISEDRKGVVHVDSATVTYEEMAPGASGATVWGDAEKGAHSTFTKFAPGSEFKLHTHTNDLRIVVLKGAYVYKPENGEEKRVTAGQYLLLPGGDRHATGSDAEEGALFYQEADGKFDINFVE